MRVQQSTWTVKLNKEDRALHARTFPLRWPAPDITIRRLLPNHRFVVEAMRRDGSCIRLGKTGKWERAGTGHPRPLETFSALDAAVNAIHRGESDDEEPARAAA